MRRRKCDLYRPPEWHFNATVLLRERTERNRDKSRENRKASYYLRKEHGICVQCGHENAEPGMVLCWQCRMYNNQRRSGAQIEESQDASNEKEPKRTKRNMEQSNGHPRTSPR